MACFAVPVQSTVWSSAIATRFRYSRGLALAVAMCGGSLASALFPWMATLLMEDLGWRTALFYQAAIWAALTFPIMFLFFRGARDGRRKGGRKGLRAPELTSEPGMTLREGIKSSVYRRMLIAGTLFTFAVPTLVVNFIVIQTDGGIDAVAAAKVAGLIGVSSIVGRIGTGLLIDRLNAAVVGALALLMPAVACSVLLFTGITPMGVAMATILLGLTQGAEIDIFGYLTTRYFGLRSFGSLFGGVLLALSLGTGLGPLVASKVFDVTGNYSGFMWLTIASVIAASLCFATLPRPGLLVAAGAER
jgi:predicted MFS family arabinose efflux permease